MSLSDAIEVDFNSIDLYITKELSKSTHYQLHMDQNKISLFDQPYLLTS